MTSEELRAPYAPAANMELVFGRIRDPAGGLPEPVTSEFMVELGIPAGNATRATAALRHFGIIDARSMLTDLYHQLRRATDEEYSQILAQILRRSYTVIFERVDPATATSKEIEAAFHDFVPAQHDRMASLFIGLCRLAHISPSTELFMTNTVAERPIAEQPRFDFSPEDLHMKNDEQLDDSEGTKDESIESRLSSLDRIERLSTEIRSYLSSLVSKNTELPPFYERLSPLLYDLPRSGTWTKRKRDRWIQALNAQIDYLIDIEDLSG